MMKKKTINYIIIAIVTIIVLYFSLKDNFNEIMNQIITMNVWYLLIAFLLLIIFWIFRT